MIIFEKDSLSPDTWVNVWSIDWMNRAEFYCCCQVQDIEDDELDHYALEPIDENGIPIEAEKLQLNRESEVGIRESEFRRWNSGVGSRNSEFRIKHKTRYPLLTPDS